ncbi:hypothetical protein A2Z00_04810 [Candidatus Gottesmanbacteria bacterium RBG_13_45_10]|uniref:Beta-lactamase class A catalytic domain-containing protein n=1 Tax=Candidatus Gottesmanbacteria bacterium RBG_13_45_10 TaxID=1798370 RepID=A0A1F5ZGB5_9BACT|nr:MAG: hypothetical protein A2Z00_04810 [Candidatus Gottesmanbacteria bacterium RBG_13_45_10]
MNLEAANQARKQPQKRKRRLWLLLTIIAGVALLWYIIVPKRTQVISPLAQTETAVEFSILALFRRPKNSTELRRKVEETIKDTWKNYSVLVVDYHSNFTMGINDAVIFNAASINKIPILAALYTDVQKGDVDFDKVIILQSQDVQDYGTGIIRYDPEGTAYTVKTLIRLMMQKSDNTAAHILGNYIIGLDRVQTLVNAWGLTQTDMANNKTSNKDMAILMDKIFRGKIAGVALTQEILAFLKDSDFEDRIPALLPKNVTVYHKVGTGTGTVHDVGVVTQGKTAYYIGIFSSDITDEERASKLAAQVSKVVYDYMSSH